MTDLINKIVANPSNKKLLSYLEIDLKKNNLNLRQWYVGRDGFDEGGSIFFENYGKEIPANCKYVFESKNIMINPESGEIFAFHIGRFSIFFRCDFEKSELINADHFRKGFTFDCIRDITILEENWAFLENADFEGDEQNQFKWSYEKIKSK